MKGRVSFPVTEFFSVMAFWFLFPGFFIYQVLINLRVLPSFLGGYFGLVAAAFFPFLLGLFVYQFARQPSLSGLLERTFLVLMFYIVLVSVLNYLFGQMSGYDDLLYWSLSGVMFNLSCFVIAKYINLQRSGFVALILVSFFVVAVLFFLNVQDGIFTLLNTGVDGSVTYQGYARSIVAVSFILVALRRSNWMVAAVVPLSVVILTVIGSRSELILYVFTLIFSFYYLRLRSLSGIASLVLISLIMGLLAVTFNNVILESLQDTRLYDFVENGVFNSSSGDARLKLTESGWNNIASDPVFGRYGIYVKQLGSVGSYPHNLLSAWLNLGIVGFLLYLFIALGVFFQGLILARRNGTPYSLVLLFFSIFCITSFVTSKDYLFMFLGFTVGWSVNVYRYRVF